MLTMDTDLEADLSIDSIKKMEIIGGLQNRIKMPENDEEMELHFEKIVSVKTFRDLTSWVEELGKKTSGGSAGTLEMVSVSSVVDFSEDYGDTARLTFTKET